MNLYKCLVLGEIEPISVIVKHQNSLEKNSFQLVSQKKKKANKTSSIFIHWEKVGGTKLDNMHHGLEVMKQLKI